MIATKKDVHFHWCQEGRHRYAHIHADPYGVASRPVTPCRYHKEGQGGFFGPKGFKGWITKPWSITLVIANIVIWGTVVWQVAQ